MWNTFENGYTNSYYYYYHGKGGLNRLTLVCDQCKISVSLRHFYIEAMAAPSFWGEGVKIASWLTRTGFRFLFFFVFITGLIRIFWGNIRYLDALSCTTVLHVLGEHPRPTRAARLVCVYLIQRSFQKVVNDERANPTCVFFKPRSYVHGHDWANANLFFHFARQERTCPITPSRFFSM